jgi:hypothetical protein
MTNFSQQITDFTNNGTYNYIFDSAGNEIVNPSSSVFQQVYFSIPLGNYDYNTSKINSFYDSDFTEFIPVAITSSNGLSASVFPQAAIDQINAVTYQNVQLQSQLQSLIASSEQNSGSADIQSIKNTIISLRIQLGQGSLVSDFEDVYPYLPIPLESQNPTLS